jgi:hypothetical protein
MDAEDAWAAELKRLLATQDPDPLALDQDTAERLLDGDLPPDQAPPGYAEVAGLLAATVAAPSPAELTGQEAALAELRTVTRPRRVAVPRGVGKPGRRRRTGLVVAVAVGALSTGGIAAAATGHLPDPIRDTAQSIFATGADATPRPSPNPGWPPAPHAGKTDAGGATTDGQGARPAGEPESTAMRDAVNDDRCRASRARKGADKHKQLDAATSKAPAEGAGGADRIAAPASDPDQAAPRPTGKRSRPRPAITDMARAATRLPAPSVSPAGDREAARDRAAQAIATDEPGETPTDDWAS